MEKERRAPIALDNLFLHSSPMMHSNTRDLDDLLHQKLDEAFQRSSSQEIMHDITKIASEHSPIDLAYAASYLSPNVRPILFGHLPDLSTKIEFLIHTDPATRQKIFRYMRDLEIKQLLENMANDEAVRMLEDISQRRYLRLLELLPSNISSQIKKLKRHHRNSAARLMSDEFFAFEMDMTLGQVAEYIRNYPRIDFTKGIFIIDENKQLQGYVPGRNLIINDKDLSLRSVMRPIFYKVFPDATREEVVDLLERYKISSLPVVDDKDQLLGVIANEDVLEVMEDLSDETLAKISGTVEKVASNDPIYKRFLARFPWLLVTLVMGLINMLVMSSFHQLGGPILTFVLFFVPLITGMSGNIGIQSSTVLVRSMAIGAISSTSRFDAVFKELRIGLFGGIVFGIGCSLLIYLIGFIMGDASINPIVLSTIIGTGLVGACFTATLLGSFLPMFFSRIGVDPAVASGPLVTAFNDFFSMTIYFLIAWFLGLIFL